jgi:chondroitin AC lyase
MNENARKCTIGKFRLNCAAQLRLGLIALALFCSTLSRANDLSTVRNRFVHAVLPPDGEPAKSLQRAANDITKAQLPDGSWKDVIYTDQARSNWLTARHLNNLLQMAKANAQQPDAKLKTAIVAGIAWWLKNDPHNPNWWHNEIGVPQLLGETALLMGDDLPDDQRAGVINIMKRSVWTKWTGQNLVWGCGNQIVRGILERNEKTVADAYKRMYEEIRVEKPQGEGIMPDASFHQHGSQFYSGGYGLAFANDVGRFVAYAWETQFQVPPPQMAIYTRFMLDGEQWMIRGGTGDHAQGQDRSPAQLDDRAGLSAGRCLWIGQHRCDAGQTLGAATRRVPGLRQPADRSECAPIIRQPLFLVLGLHGAPAANVLCLGAHVFVAALQQ